MQEPHNNNGCQVWMVSLKEPDGKVKVGEECHCVHFYTHWILNHVNIHYLVNLLNRGLGMWLAWEKLAEHKRNPGFDLQHQKNTDMVVQHWGGGEKEVKNSTSSSVIPGLKLQIHKLLSQKQKHF